MSEFFHRALASIQLAHPFDQLWSLSDPDVVWSYNKMADLDDIDRYTPFFAHASDCVQLRIRHASNVSSVTQDAGCWLFYYPYQAMFEDVAISETEGFFGSGDCPPPAFWTHIERDCLVSFFQRSTFRLRRLASIFVSTTRCGGEKPVPRIENRAGQYPAQSGRGGVY